jgi:hypothetical protein
MVAAAPQTGDLARRSKHPRPVDNPGGRGAGDGDLDHVDAEQGGTIVALDIDAARQFLAVAHIACARDVDDDPVRIRIDDRMGMAAAAGLHLADLARLGDVRDVKDPDAAETLGADLLQDPLKAAISAAARFLDAHDKEPAGDRNVALPAGAHGRADQLRRAVGAEAIDVEAVKAARHHHIAGKGHVGIGEVQQ